MNDKEKHQVILNSVCGCLFGGAIGDAWGYPVEFLKYKQIINEYGEDGITELRLKNGKAEISDDTQMTLYTANGILYGETRSCLRGTLSPLKSYIFMAYKEWYKSQTEMHRYQENNDMQCCWIYNIDVLHNSRAPGNTCLSAIATSNGAGNIENLINDSKGCGGVMRVAPIGCYFAARNGKENQAAIEGAETAALTHGHTLGFIPAAFLSCLIFKIIKDKTEENNKSLYNLVEEAKIVIKKEFGNIEHYNEFEEITDKAIKLSKEIAEDVDAINQLGQGWVAEETLAIALYSVLKYKDRFKKAIICAVNHDGDSDSTGAVAGNIIGAYLGLEKMDEHSDMINKIEAYEVIYELAQDLVNGCPMYEYGEYTDVKWMSKYVYCNYGI